MNRCIILLLILSIQLTIIFGRQHTTKTPATKFHTSSITCSASCTLSANCPVNGQICLSGACTFPGNVQCGGACTGTGAGGTMFATGTSNCASGLTCVNSVCVSNLMNGCSCTSGTQCSSGFCSNSSICAYPAPNNISCSINSDCASNNCSSGVCVGIDLGMNCGQGTYSAYACGPGMYCIAPNTSITGSCGSRIQTGSFCATSDFYADGCVGGSFCDFFGSNGTCRQLFGATVGQPCSGGPYSNLACVPGLTCISGQCSSSAPSACDQMTQVCPLTQSCACNSAQTNTACSGTSGYITSSTCLTKINTLMACLSYNDIPTLYFLNHAMNDQTSFQNCTAQMLAVGCDSGCSSLTSVLFGSYNGPLPFNCKTNTLLPLNQTLQCTCSNCGKAGCLNGGKCTSTQSNTCSCSGSYTGALCATSLATHTEWNPIVPILLFALSFMLVKH